MVVDAAPGSRTGPGQGPDHHLHLMFVHEVVTRSDDNAHLAWRAYCIGAGETHGNFDETYEPGVRANVRLRLGCSSGLWSSASC